MNRAQMVEAAARVMAGLEPGEAWPTNTVLGGGYTGTRDDEYRDGLREQAREVLDAILPQVTTVTELEALPHRVALLINRNGATVHKMREWADEGGQPYYAISSPSDTRWTASTLIEYAGRQGLTVVWQPEVTS